MTVDVVDWGYELKLVEFTGLPGAGKTSVSRASEPLSIGSTTPVMSIKRAVEKGLRVPAVFRWSIAPLPRPLASKIANQLYRSFLKDRYRHLFRRCHAELWDEVKVFQERRRVSDERKQLVLNWFLDVGGRFQFFESNLPADDHVFFCEGFCHRVIALFVSEWETVRQPALESYLSKIPKPRCLVDVTIDDDVGWERLHSRGFTDHLRWLEAGMLRRFLRNSREAIDMTTDFLSRSGIPLVVVDNSGKLGESALELRAKLSTVRFTASS